MGWSANLLGHGSGCTGGTYSSEYHVMATDANSVAPACTPDPAVATTATAVDQEGRHGNSAVGGAWLAVLAQAQANRDTAAAMLHAMQAQYAFR